MAIGIVARPHGLGGEVLVDLLTDFPERFDRLAGEQLLLERDDMAVRTRVAEVKWVGGRPCLRLDCSRSLAEAEALRRAVLKIPDSRAVKLAEGEYYWHQIVGLRVCNRDGSDLGTVTEVLRLPAHDVYVTARAMVPAVKEIVKEIDLDGGTITVDMPPEY